VSRFNTRAYSTYAQGVAAYAGQYREHFLAPVLNDLMSNASMAKLSQDFIASGYASAGYNVGDFVGGRTPAQLDGNLRDINGNVVTSVTPLSPDAVKQAELTVANIGPGGLISPTPITGLGNSASGAAGGITGALTGMAQFFAALMSWDTWKRILLIGAGGALVVIGFVLVKEDSFSEAGKTIAELAPVVAA
jgi:hypothetical protein